ncbi:MAG: alpha/beta fold hydrolase [Alphaproteobacteria bacterium]|nr:alpha/beta fold hydrolase [Alphaproteobacteria bacterium]
MKIHANGARIAYRYDGVKGAPVVVLAHCLATSRKIWGYQLPLLTERYAVLRYDLRGHGKSGAPKEPYTLEKMADDAAALLQHLGIEKVRFVGLSIGGMIAQMMALRHPAKVEAIAICSSTSRIDANGRKMWDDRIDAVLAGGIETQVEPTIGRWFTPGFVQSAPITVDWVRGLIRRTPAHGFIGSGRAIQGLDLTEKLAGIKTKVLVMPGELDQGTPVAASEAIRSRIPGAKMVVLKGAAHVGNVERPNEFNEALMGFLASV